MKRLTALLLVTFAAVLIVSACAKSSDSGTTSTSTASTDVSQASPMAPAPKAAALPIPLKELPVAAVAAGNAAAGAKVYAANCASCHGVGGKNGQVGPSLYGAGLKAGQVAYMIRNPQGVDKSSGMPKLPLTNKQVADVAAYVASLK